MLQNHKLPQKHRVATWVKNLYWDLKKEWSWYRNIFIITRLVWFFTGKVWDNIPKMLNFYKTAKKIYFKKWNRVIKSFVCTHWKMKNWITKIWWMIILTNFNLAAYEQDSKLPAGKFNLYSNKICFLRNKYFFSCFFKYLKYLKRNVAG